MVASTLTQPSEASAIHNVEPLDAEVERLVIRLERGFDVIETARAAGEAVGAWEDAWIQLLRRYESLVDRQAA